MISKEEFVDTLNFIKRKVITERNFIHSLEALSPSTYCDCFLYDEYEVRVINLLEDMFEDKHNDICHFLYECDWIEVDEFDIKRCPKHKNRYLYKSPETLYDYLVKEMRK